MDIITYSQARSNLSATMDKVTKDNYPVAVTRKNSEPVVMISLDEYNAWQTTLHLYSTKKNRERLLDSIEDLEKGNYQKRELVE